MLVIIGCIALSYPTLSILYNQYRNNILASSYNETVEELPEEDLSQMWQEAIEYNEQHEFNYIQDAFTDSEDYILTHPYDTLLNPMGNDIMGYLEVPKAGIELPIYHGVGEEYLQKGCGHVEGTSLPIGGKSTHTVIAGHNGLRGAQLFTHLDEMKEGDQFYIHIMDKVFAYEVDQVVIVLPEDISPLAIEPGKDLATLLTCTPYGANTHRLLVRGHRVPYIAGADESMDYSKWLDTRTIITLLAILIIVIAIIIIRRIRRRKQEKEARRKEEAKKVIEETAFREDV